MARDRWFTTCGACKQPVARGQVVSGVCPRCAGLIPLFDLRAEA